jgi:hypothetical protein
LINDSWKVLGFVSARRCLPVRVGRRSSPEQSGEPLRSVFFVDAFRVVASGVGVDVAEAEDSVGAAVGIAVCIQLGGAELGTVYPAVEGDGFVRIAEPLLVPLTINATATASTIVAPKTRTRRTQ